MTTDKKLSPNSGILNAPPYIAGSHTIDGFDTVAILSANENPLGCSPAVKHALSTVELNRYPSGGAIELRQAIGKQYNLNDQNIVCGAGSDEILQLLIHAYASVGDEVLYPEYGFLVYPIATLTAGATPVKAPEKNYTVDVDNLLNAITPQTKIICIANPANPTGTLLSKLDLQKLIDATPNHILIILDGAYAEYVEDNTYTAGAEFVENYENVVMTRTFSKAYGLASVRLGWAYCSPSVADVLNRVRGPFNVSSPAQSAGLASIADQDFIKKSVLHNTAQKKIVSDSFIQQGLVVIPSHTNFILVKFKSEPLAEAGFKTLQAHGVATRLVKAYGLSDCLRITIGTENENKQILNAVLDMQV